MFLVTITCDICGQTLLGHWSYAQTAILAAVDALWFGPTVPVDTHIPKAVRVKLYIIAHKPGVPEGDFSSSA